MEYEIKAAKGDLYLVEMGDRFAQVSMDQLNYSVADSPHVFLKWGYFEPVSDPIPEELKRRVSAILQDQDRCTMDLKIESEDGGTIVPPQNAICGGMEATWITEKNAPHFKNYLPQHYKKFMGNPKYLFLGLVEQECAYGAMVAKQEGTILEIRWMQVANIVKSVMAERVFLETIKALLRDDSTITEVTYTASGDEATLNRFDDLFQKSGFSVEVSGMQTWAGVVRDIFHSETGVIMREEGLDPRVRSGKDIPEIYLKRFLTSRLDFLDPDQLDQNACSYFMEGQKITAALLIKKGQDGSLSIVELINESRDKKAVLWLVRSSFLAIRNGYAGETAVYFASDQERMWNLGQFAGFHRLSHLAVHNYRWRKNT